MFLPRRRTLRNIKAAAERNRPERSAAVMEMQGTQRASDLWHGEVPGSPEVDERRNPGPGRAPHGMISAEPGDQDSGLWLAELVAGLASQVRDPHRQVFTRWDAKGVPQGVGGREIAHPVRLFHLADTVEVFHRAGGVDAAVEMARSRRGKHFDPEVVDLFCEGCPDVLADIDAMAELGALILER